MELLQQTEYDVTNVEISLEGLDGKMSGYHIHMVIMVKINCINTYKDLMSCQKFKKNYRYTAYFNGHFIYIIFTDYFYYYNVIVNIINYHSN